MPNERPRVPSPEEYTNLVWPHAGRKTVGFVRMDGDERVSLGSGTLVKFGRVAGVLTCAHVVKCVVDERRRTTDGFGLFCFSVRGDRPQRLTIRKDAVDSVILGERPDNEYGPDLAFIRLPAVVMASIESLGTGVNGDQHRQWFLSGEPAETVDINHVCGVIHQFTVQGRKVGRVENTWFEGVISKGCLFPESPTGEMDRLRFEPIIDPGAIKPTDYGGTSGGGLWRFFLAEDDLSFVQARLHGVAFFQKPIDGEMHIICHGPESVYGTLYIAIVAKWPEASAA